MSEMSDTLAAQQRPILVVEDSDEDYEAFLRAFQKVPVSTPIHRCKDGDDCLAYLYQTGEYAQTKPLRPSLLLLDLNLPGTDGREVLEKMESDSAMKSIPVVVVTTSSSPEYVELCYRNGANTYITKSHNWNRFEDTVRILLDYWFNAAVLP
jgi:CheY-like chemotaxis protein